MARWKVTLRAEMFAEDRLTLIRSSPFGACIIDADTQAEAERDAAEELVVVGRAEPYDGDEALPEGQVRYLIW